MEEKPVIQRDGLTFVWFLNGLKGYAEALNGRTVSISNPESATRQFFENAIMGPPAGKEDGLPVPYTSYEMQENGFVGIYTFKAG
jgi:hypothetical protein